jgi:hypothetical protein
MRLGFSYHDEAELDEATRRMARALATMHSPNASESASRPRAAPPRGAAYAKPALDAR